MDARTNQTLDIAKEIEEQARLLGMSAERELAMRSRLENAERKIAKVVKMADELAVKLKWALPSAENDVDRLKQSLSGPQITQDDMAEYETQSSNLEDAQSALATYAAFKKENGL